MATFGQNNEVLKRVDTLRIWTNDMDDTDILYDLPDDEYAKMYIVELTLSSTANTSLEILYTSGDGFNGKIEVAQSSFGGGTNNAQPINVSASYMYNNNYVLMPAGSRLQLRETSAGTQNMRFYAMVFVYSTVGGSIISQERTNAN